MPVDGPLNCESRTVLSRMKARPRLVLKKLGLLYRASAHAPREYGRKLELARIRGCSHRCTIPGDYRR